MPKIKLQRGDVFAVNSESLIANAINSVSAFWSTDGESQMNHCGIIVNEQGRTFEAKRRVDEYDLSQYIGRRMVIARLLSSETNKKVALMRLYREHQGSTYPFWRIPLHLIPPLARAFSYQGKFLVCSEVVAKYEHMVGNRHKNFAGTRPDTLVDEWRKWRSTEIIFDGVFRGELIN